MKTTTGRQRKLRGDKRGLSSIIVVTLSLVIIVAIVSNVFLWSYQMNQLDWEKMKENIKLLGTTGITNSSWFVTQNEYVVTYGTRVSGDYTDTQMVDDTYETFEEENIEQILYLHRIDASGLTPTGKLMNTTQPLSNTSETTYSMNRGASSYFYTPPLSAGSIENGTWTLYVWASTESSGKVSSLTVQIYLVSSDGTVEKATIGTVANVIIDYGYSERTTAVSGSAANVTSGDRIRLTLYAQTGAENDPKGMSFYYDGYGAYETLGHETRLQSPFQVGCGLDLKSSFEIDVPTYPFTQIETVEIQLRYRASDTLERWYLKSYNWTTMVYSDSGFNNTSGHVPTGGWDYYALNLTDKWRSYVASNGTMLLKFQDNEQDDTQTAIDIDFLGIRVKINGTLLNLKNEGSVSSHIVSFWIINSTVHQRFDADVIVNSAETFPYIRADIRLPSDTYTIKVVTERGNIAVYVGA